MGATKRARGISTLLVNTVAGIVMNSRMCLAILGSNDSNMNNVMEPIDVPTCII